MSVTPYFTEAVQSGNKRRVRDMMADSLIRDPLFEEFEEMQREAGKFFIDLYEPYDGKPFNQDRTMWNKSCLDSAMVDLRENFSRERVNYLKEICRFVYKDKIDAEKRRRENEMAARSAYQRPSSSTWDSGTRDNAPASNSAQTNTGRGESEVELIQRLSKSAQGWYLAMMDIRKSLAERGIDKSDFQARLCGKLRKDFLEKGVAESYVEFVIKQTRDIMRRY